VLYGPHGSGAVPGGPESNRVMSGSPDGLPARPKHGTTQASGQLGPVSYRARSCSCQAKECGPRADPFNADQFFWYSYTLAAHAATFCAGSAPLSTRITANFAAAMAAHVTHSGVALWSRGVH
jgi:hypothetical protein